MTMRGDADEPCPTLDEAMRNARLRRVQRDKGSRGGVPLHHVKRRAYVSSDDPTVAWMRGDER